MPTSVPIKMRALLLGSMTTAFAGTFGKPAPAAVLTQLQAVRTSPQRCRVAISEPAQSVKPVVVQTGCITHICESGAKLR